MFTGIVQELGTVQQLRRGREADRLTVRAPRTADGLQLGESVAINGVCLSVVQRDHGAMVFEMVPETRRLTNLGKLSVGDRVNVERSLTLSDRLSGHVVLGHVDGMGRIVKLSHARGEVALQIRVPQVLRRYLVPKGPIAVDGISLTVGSRLSRDGFEVFLIPTTLSRTTLGHRRVGELVNLELDYFAKLLAQLVGQRHRLNE